MHKILGVLSLMIVVGGDNSQAGDNNDPYERLCTIYEEELDGKAWPGPTTFQRLSGRLDEEVPELEEQLSQLANFPKQDFYPALKSMAEHHTGKPWECGFIRRRYER